MRQRNDNANAKQRIPPCIRDFYSKENRQHIHSAAIGKITRVSQVGGSHHDIYIYIDTEIGELILIDWQCKTFIALFGKNRRHHNMAGLFKANLQKRLME